MSLLAKTIVPFYWSGPVVQFTAGVAASARLDASLANPDGRTIAYGTVGALPAGVTLAAGVVSYDGQGPAASAIVTFTAAADGFIAHSVPGAVTIAAAPVVNTGPTWTAQAPSTLGPYPQGSAATAQLSQWAQDAQGDAIRYARTGSAADTAPGSVTVHSTTGALTVPGTLAVASYALEVGLTDALGNVGERRVFALSVYSTSAATYVIPTSTSARTFDGSNTNGFAGAAWRTTGGVTRLPQGGDVIELAAGAHGPLEFNNLQGASDASRITVRNGSGQVTITSAVTNVVEYSNCRYVNFVFDRASQQYGLKISAPSATSAPDKFIKAEGDNSYVRWSHFELDGKKTSWTNAVQPIGFFGHHQNTQRSSGLFQQDHIVVEHFYIHHMSGEGVYFGPNYSNGSRPLRNIEIAHGLITDCGRDGVQGKCWFEGTNSMHDLEVRRCGRNTADTQAGQRFGLSINSGQADFYNNKIYESGESGIQVYTQNGPDTAAFQGYGPYTSFDCKFYNNLIVDSGVIDNAPVNTGHGITLGADGAGRCLPRGYA